MGLFSNLFSWTKKDPEQEKIEKAIEENRLMALKQGWNQTLFNSKAFNEDLFNKVKAYQHSYGLPETGIVDDATFRRRTTEKEASIISFETTNPPVIFCNEKSIPINWKKVKTFKDKDGFIAPIGTYKKNILPKRNPIMFVTHFDVCLSSKSCFEVLKQRKLSVHFLIDNDGTIYQTLDTKDIAWHAAGVNEKSVGVEISNAFYPKFNKTYEQMGFGPRSVFDSSVVHGKKIEPHLGFYPVQIEAYKALVKAINVGLGIPLKTPGIYTVLPEAAEGKYNGFVGHYNITTNKIDPVGMDLFTIIGEIQ